VNFQLSRGLWNIGGCRILTDVIMMHDLGKQLIKTVFDFKIAAQNHFGPVFIQKAEILAVCSTELIQVEFRISPTAVERVDYGDTFGLLSDGGISMIPTALIPSMYSITSASTGISPSASCKK